MEEKSSRITINDLKKVVGNAKDGKNIYKPIIVIVDNRDNEKKAYENNELFEKNLQNIGKDFYYPQVLRVINNLFDENKK